MLDNATAPVAQMEDALKASLSILACPDSFIRLRGGLRRTLALPLCLHLSLAKVSEGHAGKAAAVIRRANQRIDGERNTSLNGRSGHDGGHGGGMAHNVADTLAPNTFASGKWLQRDKAKALLESGG